MNITDEGYIINMRKHGESSLILTVVTREHGKIVGYAKGGLSKKSLGIYQLGNYIRVDAYARVEENMLSFKCELLAPTSVNFLSDPRKLACLSSLCALCNGCLPEKDNIERLFYYIDSFFNLILEDNWVSNYSYFEYYLLDYLGIGLDLSECSATGATDNLTFVSPKTAKAVSYEAGLPYKDRLFAFPHYILDNNYHPQAPDVKNLLKMTEFFLNKNFFSTHNLKFPQSRANLLSQLNI
ncbi:MAG: DNA repair protein RecO [Lactobacillus sp.]|jgi:DNA repair protein RecO (recombination protein O)|nr:DNA repair protein RecO [Lactobacillus sp.]